MKDLNELWQMVMEDLRKESGATVVDLWLGEVRPVGQEGERLLLWCPSPFKRQKVEEFWMERLKKALFNLFSFEITPVLLREEPAAPAAERAPGRYTFENFVVGPSNRTAWEAARRVAGGERDYYSPLVLYGDPGLGKTHLLRAIEEEALRRGPGTRVVRVKGDAFTNDLVDAIRFGEGAAFREKYRTADLLLMDDMQFIAGKKQTQEEFYNTFDALHQNGCAIVVTMDRPPDELERLEKRLLSRFEGGLTVAIGEPDYPTRLAILRQKAAERGLALSEEDACTLARTITGSVRRLEGALNRLRAGELGGEPVGLQALAGAFAREEEPKETPEQALVRVARAFGVEPRKVQGRDRGRNSTAARQGVMYVLYHRLGMSAAGIGKFLDRDHATVLYALRTVEQKMGADPLFAAVMKGLLEE